MGSSGDNINWVQLAHQRNAGRVAASKKAFRLGKKKYVYLSSADCTLVRKHISTKPSNEEHIYDLLSIFKPVKVTGGEWCLTTPGGALDLVFKTNKGVIKKVIRIRSSA